MQFWRPGDTSGPKEQTTSPHRDAQNSSPSLAKKYLHFLYTLEENDIVCIHVDPEADEITELPRALAAAGWSCPGKTVAVALPRQTGVLSAALRLAQKQGLDTTDLGGDYVGYATPASSRRSMDTKIMYYSCDSFVKELQVDPLLSFGSIVLVGEMQERYISTDLVVSLLRQIQRMRSDLRLVLCGTFFDLAVAESFFQGRKIARLNMKEHRHPVSVMHLRNPVADYMQAALETIKDCVIEWEKNDRPYDRHVLVFVSGADETKRLCQNVSDWFTTEFFPTLGRRKKTAHRDFDEPSSLLRVIPLHSSIDQTLFTEACQNDHTKPHIKVVVATSIAESAVSIGGVSTVVDCGFEKVHVYDAQTKISSLAVVPIAQASARQRASRAGTIGSGVCFRLYTELYFRNNMRKYRPPEILRMELSKLVLMLKMLGVESIENFEFISPPPIETLADGVDHLAHLGATDEKGSLTKNLGLRIVSSRLSPKIMKCIALGEEYGVSREIAGIAAMLEVRHSIFNSERKWSKVRSPFAVAEGDLLTLLNVWRRYMANGRSGGWCKKQGVNTNALRRASQLFEHIRKQVLKPQTKQDQFASARKAIGLSTTECIRRCIAGGFFENACMVQPDGSYLMARSGVPTWIHASSVLAGRMPRWVVFMDVVRVGAELHMRDVTVVEPQWLVDAAPGMYELLTEFEGS